MDYAGPPAVGTLPEEGGRVISSPFFPLRKRMGLAHNVFLFVTRSLDLVLWFFWSVVLVRLLAGGLIYLPCPVKVGPGKR